MHNARNPVDGYRLIVRFWFVVDDDELALGPVTQAVREPGLVLVSAEAADSRRRLEVEQLRAGSHMLVVSV
jgi:hypothetical protein